MRFLRHRILRAVYKNHHDDKPDHIVIVRPSDKDVSEIEQEGPQITQASGINYFSIQHSNAVLLATQRHEVRYFAHAIEWER